MSDFFKLDKEKETTATTNPSQNGGLFYFVKLTEIKKTTNDDKTLCRNENVTEMHKETAPYDSWTQKIGLNISVEA